MKKWLAVLVALAASTGLALASQNLAGEKLAQATTPSKDAKKDAAPAKDAKKEAAAPAKDAKKDAAPKKEARADAKKSGDLIDINTASEAELASLKGIGDVRAKAIVKGRPYKGKDDLVNKKVVPKNVYNDIKDQIIAKQK